MKIANKISLSFLTTALILTGIAAPIFYTTAKKNLEDRINAHLRTTAQSRANHIETYLKEHKQTVELLAQGVIFKELLSTSKEAPEYKQKLERVNKRINNVIEVHKEIFKVCLFDKNGIVVASTDKECTGFDKNAEKTFLRSKEASYIGSIHICELSGSPAQDIAAPVLFNSESLGVIIADIDIKQLFIITLDRTGLGKTGEIYLVNKEGYMISPSRFIKDTFLKQKVDTENTIKYFEDIKKIRKPHDHKPLIFTDYRGVKVLGLHDHICDMQWCLCAEIDEKEVLAPLAKIKIVFVITMIFVPIAAWLIGSFVSKLISRPIHKLHKGTEVIGEGNLDYKVGTDAKDEIGQLSRAFDEMAESLKQSTTSIDNLNKEITERKRIEEALRESKQRFRSLVETTSDWVWEVNQNGIYTYSSPKVKELLGYEPEEIIGKLPLDLMPTDEAERVGAIFRDIVASQKPFERLENVNLHKDGQLIVLETSGVPIFDTSGDFVGYHGIDRDITERKQAQAELQTAQEKLIDTARQMGMAETATDVLHNVGNVLNSVSVTTASIRKRVHDSKVSYLTEVVGLLEEHADDLSTFMTTEERGRKLPAFLANLSQELITEQERYLEALETLTKHVEHMAEIIQLQQSYSKTTSMVEPASVVELVEDAIRINAEALTRHGVEVKREFADLSPVLLDHHKVLQILTNLISNAKYALSDSGQDDKILTICVTEPQGGHFRIEVHDNGVGITEENLARIFEHGFTTKKHGYGFGLHSAAIAAKEMNGSLTAHSDGPGKGTVFTLELPFQTQEAVK